MIRFLAKSSFLAWTAAILAMWHISTAWALTTGDIRGIVSDTDGLPIPGVEIRLTGSQGMLGGEQKLSSDGDGNFHFVQLLPGSYIVTAHKSGFQSVTVSGIAVLVNRTSAQNVTMKAGGDEQTITVTGRKQMVDVNDVTRGEVLTKDFLQKIPTGRTYQSAVMMASGVVGGGGGNPNVAGAAYNENTYMLDGVNITDPVTGTFSLNFNYDAIQQIEVLLGGYEPEYGVSLGGVLNVITESGTNNLEFDTSVFYENGTWAPKMDARYSADGFQLAPTGFDSSFINTQINAKIAGPVIRDKAWFLFSYSSARSQISNIGVDVPRDYDGHYVMGKLTVQPSSEHRLTAMFQLDPTTIDNTIQDTPRTFPEAQARQVQGGVVGQFRWQWFLSPNVNLDTMVVGQQSFIESNSVPCTHDRSAGTKMCDPDEVEGTIDWETPGRFGANGAYDSKNFYMFYFDDRSRYNASTKLSVLSVKDPLGGSHDFKFGAEGIQTLWDQTQGFNGNVYYYDFNGISYDPQTLQNYYWIETTGPIKFRTSGSQWNLFAQDAYKPAPNVTIKYGLRYDNSIMRNDLGQPVVAAGLLGPRLYASWDPFGDQKTKIAGGWGRFNDTGRLAISDYTSVSSYGYKLYLGEMFAGGGGGFLNDPASMYDIAPRTNPNIANDNLRTPRVDEFLFMVHRQLFSDMALRANFSNKRTRFLFEPDELNVIYDQDGSAIIGARNGNPLINASRLRTPEIAQRDYVQADFSLDKANSHRWFGRLTYTFTKSTGNSRQALSGSFMNDPQTQYNYGYLYESDIRHQVKGFAAWSLPTDPWVQTIGASFIYYAGNPFERWYWDDQAQSYGIRIRERGIYSRLPGWAEASLRFSQDLDVRKGKVVLSLEATNMFNFRQPVDIDDYFVAAENRLFILYRQDPLRFQLGVRYIF